MSRQVGRHILDFHQRRGQDLMSMRAQRTGGTLAIGFGAGNDDAHNRFSLAEEARTGTMLEFASSVGANRCGVLAMTRTTDIVCRGPIRPGNQAAKLHRIAGDRGMARNRRLA
jgi:hypothetical protein